MMVIYEMITYIIHKCAGKMSEVTARKTLKMKMSATFFCILNISEKCAFTVFGELSDFSL